jgi:hypothetical protein
MQKGAAEAAPYATLLYPNKWSAAANLLAVKNFDPQSAPSNYASYVPENGSQARALNVVPYREANAVRWVPCRE